MKKRFTIMLDTKVIANIKKLYEFWTPTAVREHLQEMIDQNVQNEIETLKEKYR